MGRDGKGWGIDDLWKERGQQKARRWRIRLWDPHAKKQTRLHRDGTYDEATQFASEEQAKLRLGKTSLAGADFMAIAREYAKTLTDRGRNATHVGELLRVAKGAHEAGLINLRAPDCPQRVRHFMATTVSRRTKKGGPLSIATHNRYLVHLRAIAKYAVDALYIPANPLKVVKGREGDTPAKATFTLGELRRLVAENSNPWWLPFCLLTYTGCRVNEALHLKWEWIDWEGSRIHLKLDASFRIKRGRERSFPLQPELRDILLPRKQDIGWIVNEDIREADDKTHWKGYRRYIESCGIAVGKRSPHSSRHTWVSLLLATGEEMSFVRRWCGHKTLTTTDTYADAADSLRSAVATWKRGEFRLLTGAQVKTA